MLACPPAVWFCVSRRTSNKYDLPRVNNSSSKVLIMKTLIEYSRNFIFILMFDCCKIWMLFKVADLFRTSGYIFVLIMALKAPTSSDMGYLHGRLLLISDRPSFSISSLLCELFDVKDSIADGCLIYHKTYVQRLVAYINALI